MYNSAIKEEFIKYITEGVSFAKFCEALFNELEPYENEWGADFCTVTAEQFTPAINNIAGVRKETRRRKTSVLKKYVEWCINVAKIPGAREDALSPTFDGLGAVKKKMVASPAHLQKYLDEVYTKEEKNSVDNIYRCYHWLAFGGIAEEDIFKIKNSDVDLTNMVVKWKGNEAPIYREAVPAFKQCLNSVSFLFYHPGYENPAPIQRIPGDTLMRSIRKTNDAMRFRTLVSDRWREHPTKDGLRLSYLRVWLSGLFYRLYEGEKMGIPPDFLAVATMCISERNYKTALPPDVHIKRVVNQYKKDYEQWKIAFLC